MFLLQSKAGPNSIDRYLIVFQSSAMAMVLRPLGFRVLHEVFLFRIY